MGKLEYESRQKARIKNLQQVVLGTVAVAGALSVALLAPNALGALQKLGLSPRPRQREIITITRKRLVRDGYLSRNERGFLMVTEKGKKKLRQMERYIINNPKPRRWDKKWRVLIFDITERKRGLRDKIRQTLVAIGFARLQDSVWVYPYPCDDLITLLKSDFSIGKELLYLIVESIEYDRSLREKFGLPQDTRHR